MVLIWKSRGNCVGEPPYIFYSANLNLLDVARKICKDCPVQLECLRYAIEHNEYGVWGGKTEEERKFLKRSSLVQGLPLVDLLHRNKRVQERLASASLLHPSYTSSQRMHNRVVSEMVAALQALPFR